VLSQSTATYPAPVHGETLSHPAAQRPDRFAKFCVATPQPEGLDDRHDGIVHKINAKSLLHVTLPYCVPPFISGRCPPRPVQMAAVSEKDLTSCGRIVDNGTGGGIAGERRRCRSVQRGLPWRLTRSSATTVVDFAAANDREAAPVFWGAPARLLLSFGNDHGAPRASCLSGLRFLICIHLANMWARDFPVLLLHNPGMNSDAHHRHGNAGKTVIAMRGQETPKGLFPPVALPRRLLFAQSLRFVLLFFTNSCAWPDCSFGGAPASARRCCA